MNTEIKIIPACQQLLLPDDQTVHILKMVNSGASRMSIVERFNQISNELGSMVDNALALLAAKGFLEITVPCDALRIRLTSKGLHVLKAVEDED